MATKKVLGGSQKSLNEIQRVWGDIDVVDAKKDLRVFIQPEDVKRATRQDPGCCVFAEACKRQFSATKVLFWRSIAYVELPGPDGSRRVERFTLSPEMRDLIENFDKGNAVGTDAGFELKRPRPSTTLAASRQKNLKHRLRRKALLRGTCREDKKVNRGIARFKDPSIVVDLAVRNGSGRVQFKKELRARRTESKQEGRS